MNDVRDKMRHYYEFSGSKHGLPISICINSFHDTLFHQHKGLELAYVLSGSYLVCTESFDAVLEARGLAVVAPREIHALRGLVGDCVILVVQLDTDTLSGLLNRGGPAFISVVPERGDPLYAKLRGALSAIMTCLIDRRQDNSFAMCRAAMWIFELLSHRRPESSGIKNRELEKCIEIARFINANLQENIGLEDMAEHLHFSPSYASRFFKKNLGVTFSKYLARARIRASLTDLVEGRLTISEISNKYGFPNTKAYTNYFKEFYEVTPNTYRSRFASSARLIEYDEKNRYMELASDTRAYISHLVDLSVGVAADCSGDGGRAVGLRTGCLRISDIGYCLSGSNASLVDSVLEASAFESVTIDCADRILERLDDREFYYAFAEFISHLGGRGADIRFVDEDGRLERECRDMLELVLSKYLDVSLSFTREPDVEACGETLSDFAARVLDGRPIDCDLRCSGRLPGMIDEASYKSDSFFTMALMAKMSGRLLLSGDGFIVSKSGEQVKILLFNDKKTGDCNRMNFDLRLSGLSGRLVKTEYFADELLFAPGGGPGEDGIVSIANKRRLYVKRRGKFGNVTETLYVDGELSFRRTLEKDTVRVIVISRS